MAERYEVAEEQAITEEEALMHFGCYAEARARLPWEQRTFKERLMHHLDRLFLFFLAVFFLVVVAEAAYKIWYVTNWKKIFEQLLNSASFFFMQENQEELLEL